MDYVYQDTFHFAGGDTATSAPGSAWDLVELADGARIWQTIDDRSRSYIEIQDTDGGFHDPVRSRLGLSVNRPHSIVAWRRGPTCSSEGQSPITASGRHAERDRSGIHLRDADGPRPP